MRDMKIPEFFKTTVEGQEQSIECERLLDYFLAWTLRCTQESNPMETLRIESKKILTFLLDDKNINHYKVESVKTWDKWYQTDLCAEVILQDEKGNHKKFAMLFEEKMYGHLSDGQLEKYKNRFEAFYTSADNGKTDYERRYFFLTVHCEEEKLASDFEEAKKFGFRAISFEDIKKKTKIQETGNFMFDEFWFHYDRI